MTNDRSSDSLALARLVLRAQVGDRTALQELLARTQTLLWPYLRTLLKHHQDAEEVLQECLIRVHQRLKWLREPRAYRAWMYRVATREAVRFSTKRSAERGQSRGLGPGDAPIAVEPPEPPDERVWEHILEIAPNTRAVLVLHYKEGLSLAAVADVLGVPMGTVKSRLASGLATLRERPATRTLEAET